MRNYLISIAFLVTVGAACSRPAKKEAASLVASVDRFRALPKAEWPGQAGVIGNVECHDPEVCAARTICVAASDATARAILLTQETGKGIAKFKAHETDSNDPDVRELPKKLDEAEALLNQGRNAMSECVDKTDGLRRKYSL